AAGFAGMAAWRVGPAPAIQAEPAGGAVGRKKPVTITVTEPVRGLTSVKVELVQGDRVEKLAEKTYVPRSSWSLWGAAPTGRDALAVDIGRDAIHGLKAAPVTLRVTAERAPTWLKRPAPAVREIEYQVRLTPPGLGVISTFHFARQGGAEAVVYRAGASSVRDGVQAGDLWFPGFPLPGGGPQDRFALFAVP